MRALLLLWLCLSTLSVEGLAQPPAASLILMGPPGAGKGTQSSYLKERYHLQPISPGDLLREEIRTGTPLGKEVESCMSSGKLVPDDIVLKLLANEIDSLSSDQGVLLDGFPRSLAQAEALDNLLASRHRSIVAVVLLNLDDAQIMHRLSQRWTCPTCQRSYHQTDNPPKVEGLCDDDLTPMVQRPDDRPEVIQKRLDVYHSTTTPVAEFYRKKNLLRDVDTKASIETVRAHLVKLLDPLLLLPIVK